MSNNGFTVPSAAPADGTQHTCTFNHDWLPLLLGFTDWLKSNYLWDSPPTDIAQQCQELADLLVRDTTVTLYWPTQFLAIPPMMKINFGNGLLQSIDTAQQLNTYWQQSPNTNGSELTIGFPLKAGNYTLTIGYLKSASGGKVEVRVNGGLLTTLDTYNATAQKAQISTLTFTQSISSEAFLTFTLNGKNASSANYSWAWSFAAVKAS